jgi:ATP-dependent Clp protease ATP-binding subunit ClpC
MVMQRAQQEAQRRKHDYVGTEHILLGLVNDQSGAVVSILIALNVDPPRVADEIEKIVQPGAFPTRTLNLALTPRAKSAIVNAMKEARRLHHDTVDAAHLLVGLRQEEDGVAAEILKYLGVQLEALQEAAEKLIQRE